MATTGVLLGLLAAQLALPTAQLASPAATPPQTCPVANRTEYRTATNLAAHPSTHSAGACCAHCRAHAGCGYFSLYANGTCALKATFGEPLVSAGVTSGAVAKGPAPADYAHHDDPALLAALRSLPPLPKPHFSWPVMPTATIAEYTRDPYFLEVTRLTGSVSFSAEFATRPLVFDLVRAAQVANVSSIGIHYWGMWKRIFPKAAPPIYNGSEVAAEYARLREKMSDVRDWLAQANAELGSGVRPALVMLDSENFRTQGNGSAWDLAITDKHARTYGIVKEVFPSTTVDWFGRGGCHRGPVEQGAIDGWWCGAKKDQFFTLKEPADAFSVAQYNVWEPGYRRESFRRTVEFVRRAVAAGAAPHAPVIHTWLALGAGLKRSVPEFKSVSTGREYVDDYEYDSSYDWMAGTEINVAKYSEQTETYAPYNYTNLVMLYPSVFTHLGQLWHFVEYVRGAAQVFEAGPV